MHPHLDLGAIHAASRARWTSTVLDDRQLELPLAGATPRLVLPPGGTAEVQKLVDRTVAGPDARRLGLRRR